MTAKKISVKKQYVKQRRVQLETDPDTGMTHQSFKDECDINYLIDVWLKTGVMPVFGNRQPFYGDVSDMPGYDEARHIVAMAEQAYDQLEPEQRDLFEDALDYMEAVYASMENQVGTADPLDVTVPTDTSLKGEAHGDEVSIEEADVPESLPEDRNPSKKRTSRA